LTFTDIFKSLHIFYFHYSDTKYCSGDKIEKNEEGGACSTYGGEERCTQGFGGETEEKIPLGSLDVDGRIILKWIFRKWDGGMDWIDLSQDSDRWRPLINAVINLRVP